MSDTDPFRLEVFHGADGFQQIKPHWQKLAASMETRGFYHCPEWYEAYIGCLEKNPGSFRFYSVFEDDQLAAVFPLKRCVRRFLGIRFNSLELPRHGHMPLADVVLPPSDRACAIWRFFLERIRRQSDECWDFIRLSKLPKSSALFSVLPGTTGLNVLQNRVQTCFYCQRASAEDLSRSLSKSFRKSLRNARNRLSKLGALAFFSARTPAETESLFQELLSVEASGWKGRAGTAIAQDARLTEFYRKQIETFGPEGCALDALRIEKKTIAVTFGLRTGKTVYSIKIGIDDQYRRYSPGHLLTQYALTKTGSPEEPAIINFVGETPRLLYWKPEVMDVFDVYIFNTTAKAKIAFSQIALKHQLLLLYRRTGKPLVKQLQRNPRKNVSPAEQEKTG